MLKPCHCPDTKLALKHLNLTKMIIMKKTFLIVILSLFLFGCNQNPNKEARIQKLEKEIVDKAVEDKISK